MSRSTVVTLTLAAAVAGAWSCAGTHPVPAPGPSAVPAGGPPGTQAAPAAAAPAAVATPAPKWPEAEAPCDSCHGYPPEVGAHRVHFAWTEGARWGVYGDLRVLQEYVAVGMLPPTYPSYAFGCGNCHPTDPAKHMDGTVEVVVSGTGVPADALKALNLPGAAHDAKTGTCSGVYCHSSGQQADAALKLPVHVRTPGFTSGQKLSCTSCHQNPPRYASGGPGAVTANSHVGRAFDGYPWGHFLGLPGPHHPAGSKHGGGALGPPQDASPITCQTCHAGTVDPANAGPSGFYYLDTSGDYSVPGAEVALGCGGCHGAGQGRAPAGTGRVRPLLHANGRRDVTFDTRESLPALPWLPPNPFTPARPNWVTDGPVGYVLPGVILNPPRTPPPGGASRGSGPGDAPSLQQPTFSFDLGPARWDAATKTCSSVACHLSQTSVQWGGAPRPGKDGCNGCHGM